MKVDYEFSHVFGYLHQECQRSRFQGGRKMPSVPYDRDHGNAFSVPAGVGVGRSVTKNDRSNHSKYHGCSFCARIHDRVLSPLVSSRRHVVEPPHCRDLGKVDRPLKQNSCGSVLFDERPSSTVLCLVVTLLYVSEGSVVSTR
jgi:hypothetical protein